MSRSARSTSGASSVFSLVMLWLLQPTASTSLEKMALSRFVPDSTFQFDQSRHPYYSLMTSTTLVVPWRTSLTSVWSGHWTNLTNTSSATTSSRPNRYQTYLSSWFVDFWCLFEIWAFYLKWSSYFFCLIRICFYRGRRTCFFRERLICYCHVRSICFVLSSLAFSCWHFFCSF